MLELYAQHRGQYRLESRDTNGDPAKLDAGELESIDAVLESFKAFSAHELSAMTHHRGRGWMPVGELAWRTTCSAATKSCEMRRSPTSSARWRAAKTDAQRGEGEEAQHPAWLYRGREAHWGPKVAAS
ncbi:hypothetical protein ABID94_003238 [Streptomyces sp. PvR018]